MGLNNGLMFISSAAGFNGPATNGVSGQVIYGQGTTSTPTWLQSTSLIITAPTPATASYFSGYMGASGNWGTNSTTFAEFNNVGGNTLTVKFSNGISIAAAGNSAPAIVLTPASSSAVYEVTATFAAAESTANDSVSYRMTDGASIVIAWSGVLPSSSTKQFGTLTMGGIYAGGTSTAFQFKLQGAATGGGTCQIQNLNSNITLDFEVPAIQWKVLRIL